MNKYFILMTMLGLVLISTTILVTIMLFKKKRKIEQFAVLKQQTDFDNHIEYVACTALDRPNPKKPEIKDTTDMLDRAPCWISTVSGSTKKEVLVNTANAIKELYENNKSNGSITGPAYMVMGRNRDTDRVEAWLYLPAMSRDGVVLPEKGVIMAHQWIRDLFFTTTYGVSNWLCNNPCDRDFVQVDNRKLSPLLYGNRYNTPSIPTISPECGCISSNACKFNTPVGFSVPKRSLSSFNTYSIYRIKPSFFTAIEVPFSGLEYINSSILINGSKMHQGCSSRLISPNRRYSFEVTANGAAIYETKNGRTFDEGCITKPYDKSFVDTPKTRTDMYNTTGILPRVVNDGEIISISSIIKNKKTGKKEMVREWNANIGKNTPYMLMLDDDGSLKLLDKKGEITDTSFSRI